MTIIDVINVTKSFSSPNGQHSLTALTDISFSIHSNEFIAIVGPSGCGKSTLIRLLAGLEKPTEGEVRSNGSIVSKPSHQRAVVFQEHGLFDWMTVAENIGFGLRAQKVTKKVLHEEVSALISLMGLQGFDDYYPSQISGGMKQRVAVARAIAVNPSILLMDEPFSSLDYQTKIYLQEEILTILNKKKQSVLMVTHDLEEAIFFADRVIVLSSRPGSIAHSLDVKVQRPRSLSFRLSDLMQELKHKLWTQLGMRDVNEAIKDKV